MGSGPLLLSLTVYVISRSFGKSFLIEGSNEALISSDRTVEKAGSAVFITLSSTFFKVPLLRVLPAMKAYVLLTILVVFFGSRVMSTVLCEPREKSISASRVNCSEERKLPEACFADNIERRTVRVQAKKICFSISAVLSSRYLSL